MSRGARVADVKFCGLTRAEDARVAASLGAAYLGVIFAGGPRLLTPAQACDVLDGALSAERQAAVRRVGVFGAQSAEEFVSAARAARLDVAQLHGGSDAGLVSDLRARFDGEIWRVVRVAESLTPDEVRGASEGVDAVLFDALVAGGLGGTGRAVDWRHLASLLERAGRPARVVLAGGLHADNVAEAIGLVAPEVVDVSSGVEAAVGVKDHAKMRAFAESAARGGR
jgi:phosphoribosylanthranilate isomerase